MQNLIQLFHVTASHTASNCFCCQGECNFVRSEASSLKKMKALKFIAKIENLRPKFLFAEPVIPKVWKLNGVEIILIENKTWKYL